MTQALERAAPTASRLAQVTGFSDQQISLIAQTVAPGASRLELAWFLYNAGRLELEPTLDQIYLIKYKADQVGEIVIGINGYRAMAESSGSYAGSDDALFEYEDIDQPRRPSKATVTVWKIVQGMRVPFSASARWEEFYPGDGKIGEQYRKRPHNQLAIRAESHALRKAFPYQTRKLETRAEVPAEWREAAEADETARHDPALVANNARKYDLIFETEAREKGVMERETARPHRPPTTVDASTGEVLDDEEPPAEDLTEALEDNRRLLDGAESVGVKGLHALTAKRSWPLERILSANAELRARLESRAGEAEQVAVLAGQAELPA
jgi:phage recombination protein Bet